MRRDVVEAATAKFLHDTKDFIRQTGNYFAIITDIEE